jgi:VIT1/CCC1 family predicted Fe2+/Mn2+ transporter
MNDSPSSTMNWLRAAVLGANDGIVSIAALIVGVASATSDTNFIFLTGVAGLISGALSMSVGEYVSVSTQRDVEENLIKKEKAELAVHPAQEMEALALFYQKKGLTTATAQSVAAELTAHDPITAHLEIESHIDPDDLTNPWHAAIASAISYFVGGIIPLAAMLLTSQSLRIPFTYLAVLVALVITGYLSARVSKANPVKAILRVLIGGVVAMVATTGIGHLLGAAGY